ncbi:septation protein SepH [Microbacterium candidum]|uniref:Septation protein SepH n=1 Tax=Microbacterium candidum TaxID=3041922 RepID=A0ABT7MZ61_9MICO|nr:septation protein SepH [Microbacterium sp. ASV49]MDL9979710.1 septation protein SepH [Microbacterium sp. ASV49]
MEQLRVVGEEDGKLVLATESGERFALPVDDVLRAELRRARREREAGDRQARPSPREVQAHIRAGLSAEEVAALLGARVEDVARFEGPVLAEREHVVGQALAVPVLLGSDFDSDAPPTFGSAVRGKLSEAGAVGERWTSWKEPTGWIVKLEFTAAEVDRDARWSFDPRRGVLAPLNPDAIQLSRQGSLPDNLIPRLRALDTPTKDDSRFDSGAFGPRRMPAPEADLESPVVHEPVPSAVQDAAIKRAPETSQTSSQTADLLEALRRRRGQRETMPVIDEDDEPATSTRPNSPVALFDALEADDEPAPQREPEQPAAAQKHLPKHAAAEPVANRTAAESARRKGRTSMPSWDEIVFGARTED